MSKASPDKSKARQGQTAYQQLISEIRSGQLRPHDRLNESEIAARLGLSRTPIREAMRQLETEGLVVHAPHVGASVRALDYSEVTELYEMRAVLEATAARLSARTASDIEILELASINQDMADDPENTQRIYTLNQQFHRALLNAARNRFLVKSVEAVEKTLFILGPSTMEDSTRAAEAIKEHAQVVEAIKSRDGASAEAAMRHHIEAAHRARLQQLRQNPDT